REHGPYDNYEGSSLSKGILQYDMCDSDLCPELDWSSLKQRIKEYGVRNSLLIAPMPTASHPNVLARVQEGPFPNESNLMFRETTGGSFIYVEREMAEMLIFKGLWTPKIIGKILDNNGSIQDIKEFPEEMKSIYKTAFEYSYETIIDHVIDRSLYIDQSQSLNNYIATGNSESMIKRLFNSHIRAWKGGLKTIYYTRSMSSSRSLDIKTGSSPKPPACINNNSELFSKEIPEFTNEYRIKRINNGYKQHGFSQVSPIGGKREMYFEIFKKTMNELETANEIRLKISRKDIEKVFDAPDGFDIEHVVKLEKWDTISGDDLLICDKQYEMMYRQEDIFSTMIREVFEETGLDIKR
ncbi:1043_t:CDS:2, partial [Racocetra persica]